MSDETLELVRPAKFSTDYEWACDLVETVWELEERLHEAHDALRATVSNVNAWVKFEEEFEASRGDA